MKTSVQNNFESQHYGVRIYDLETKKTLEEIIKKSKVKAKYNQEARNFTQLIEHFEFPIACNNLTLCPDGKHLWSSGIYPPQIHCYELDQLTLKFSRNITSEIIKMIPLSSDFRKLVMMGNDRSIQIHAAFGAYHSFKLPKIGRDMLYDEYSTDLFIVGNSNEIYRFNFENGIFKEPIPSKTNTSNINCIEKNPIFPMISIGNDNGYVECFDKRDNKNIGKLKLKDDEANTLKFDPIDGLTLAVGTIEGKVLLFDIRKDVPYLEMDHHYEEPIKKIHFHDITKNIISCDSKVIRIWKKNGDIYSNIEPPSTINDFLFYPKSGMMFVAGERQKIKPYYIPSLGNAPKWCSFVDSITEELEEIKKSTVYQDYKFLTQKELEDLGYSDLIGTDVLRPYMHGFFMKINLYQKLINENKKQEDLIDEDFGKDQDFEEEEIEEDEQE